MTSFEKNGDTGEFDCDDNMEIPAVGSAFHGFYWAKPFVLIRDSDQEGEDLAQPEFPGLWEENTEQVSDHCSLSLFVVVIVVVVVVVVCLFVCLFIYLFVCLFIYLFNFAITIIKIQITLTGHYTLFARQKKLNKCIEYWCGRDTATLQAVITAVLCIKFNRKKLSNRKSTNSNDILKNNGEQ